MGIKADSLQITDLELQQWADKPKQRSRAQTKAKAEFMMLPYERTLAAAGRMKCAALAVLVELAHRRFKTKDAEVVLTNSALRSVGISYKAKLHALRQLEAAGMIKVRQRGKRRSPAVVILWDRN